MLTRLFFTTIYSILILSLSGIADLAAAATSCQDHIAPGATSYKYADALVHFVFYNGKTYAIAKSAVTGATVGADAYFAFNARIDNEYRISGVDNSSLRKLLALGKYGDARPVIIKDQETLDWIIKQYGRFLGDATSAQSTYVNAWKDFGLGLPFLQMSGGALPFTNWVGSPPDVSKIKEPQAVTMGKDGLWHNGQNGQRLSQIVEFDGQLDCAIDLTPLPGPFPPDPPPPDSKPKICGEDINNDGDISANEMSSCIETPQGDYCPTGAVACVNQTSDPYCPPGSGLDINRNMCQADFTATCGDGYIYDSSLDRCVSPAQCLDGGSLNPTTDKCEKIVSNDCPVDYTYDSILGKCTKTPTCQHGVYVPASDRCEFAWTASCPSGWTYNASSGICQRAPYCSSGSYSTTYDRCTKTYYNGCPTGYTYNAATARCEKAPDCGQGTFDPATNKCTWSTSSSPTYSCTSGTLSGTQCVTTQTANPTSGYLSSECRGNVSFCNAAYYDIYAGWTTCQDYYGALGGLTYCITQCNAQCSSNERCEIGWNFDTGTNLCKLSTYTPAIPSCFSGTFDPGSNQCVTNNQINPTCPSGSFDYSAHICYALAIKQCDSGFTYDAASNLCLKYPDCFGGVLNWSLDRCETVIAKSCLGYSYDSTADVCYSQLICDQGSYDADSNQCVASATNDCGSSYFLDAASGMCQANPQCMEDPLFSLHSTIAYSSDLDVCVSETEHSCPSLMSYTDPPIQKCEAVPVCIFGTYDPDLHKCNEGMTCPLGVQYACMEVDNSFQCSPNKCLDPDDQPEGAVQREMDQTMLQDDARNPDGSCAGQIMIFNGKASRCRPPGLDVGYLNDCCESDKFTTEDLGNNISTVASGIRTAWQIGQVAYYSYGIAQGAIGIEVATGTVVSISAGGGTTAIATVSAEVAQGLSVAADAAMAGEAAAGTISSGIGGYAAALLNPATIIVAVVVMVVMKVLFGSGCDQGDIQAGEQVKSDQCHYVGDYCANEWPTGCVQKAKAYCCFNSKMARIIQEQGRPQLTAFGAIGGWGPPDNPDCRGFTPEEFEALDFSKIDLSEYYSEIQSGMEKKIEKAQEQITTTIQNRAEQIK